MTKRQKQDEWDEHISSIVAQQRRLTELEELAQNVRTYNYNTHLTSKSAWVLCL